MPRKKKPKKANASPRQQPLRRDESHPQYARWVELLHLQRPTAAEMDELTALNRTFRTARPPRAVVTDPAKPPRPVIWPTVSGGLPSLGKRR